MNPRPLKMLLCLAGLASVISSTARAGDTKKACSEAYDQAQTLRDAHKLKAARDYLRTCSQSTCKAFIAKECTSWLIEVEGRVPSVVLSAKDARGQPLTAVTVAMDETGIAQKLDGQAIEVDPGQHVFTFVASDGTKVEQPFIVLEGQKAQAVATTIPTAASLAALKAELEAARPVPSPSFWTKRRTIAAASAGIGVVGVAVGAVFGGLALSAANQQTTDCASPTNCINHAHAMSDHSIAVRDGTISTVAFLAGAALFGSGGVLFFTGRPSQAVAASTSLLVVPNLTLSSGGISLRVEF